MMLLELQKGIIYGPIRSRRLGWSLGINILPANRKVCAFNCLYCQYGWTKIHKARLSRKTRLPSVNAVKDALKEALISLKQPPAYITFSGNGEPTLHPDFGPMVEEIISVRDQQAPEAKTAVLSNSALVSVKEVRESLSKLNVRIMKLDCGSPEIFKKYNQPCPGVDLEQITKGLAQLSDVIIQTLVTSGKNGNFEPKSLCEWIERLRKIRPTSVQIYTLDRSHPAKNLEAATKDELNWIKNQVEEAGIAVGIFG